MKLIKNFIIGTLITLAISVSTQQTYASVCGPGEKDIYLKIYCETDLNENEDRDKDLIEILSAQYDMDAELIDMILSNSICTEAKKLTTEQKAELPETVKTACTSEKEESSKILAAEQVFSDIRNSYAKENAIKLNQESLEKKFEASEIFWDGKLINSEFDLMLDLNLIEYVLFGSGADWTNDVYKFPMDEDSEGDDDEISMDDLLSSDSDTGTTADETPSSGTSGTEDVTDSDGDGIPDDCVPADDPRADTGDGPGSDYVNELCGNGSVDILMAEQCDDGNLESGDGCNQYCQTESNGAGNDSPRLQCIDDEAVSFKTLDTSSSGVNGTESGSTDGSSSNTGTDGTGGSSCPPGTFPQSTTGAGLGTGLGTDAAGIPVIQSPSYPGPFIGGTMKEFPASNRPACGPGETELTAESPGMEWLAGDESVCIPTSFCADPNLVRKLLFGNNWATGPNKDKALAIEASFCVDIKKENRPLAPYSQYEGCIDCHITAMADSLEEALATNVTPLENTTSAFGISSKFGPSFSFNLNTSAKAKPRFLPSDTAKDAINQSNQSEEKSYSSKNPPLSSLKGIKTGVETLLTSATLEEAAIEGMKKDSDTLMMTSGTVTDQEAYNRIKPLLEQMKDSLKNIQGVWNALVQSTTFDEIKQCRP